MDKKQIRKNILKKRNSLPFEYVQQSSGIICEKIKKLLPKNSNVFIYIPMESEVDTTLLFDYFTQVCVPKCVDGTTMVAVKDYSNLEKTAFGTLEPIDGSVTEDIDAVIVPGVAFSTDMDRLGYGGGYYDRFFAKHTGLKKIAVCFECQLCNEVKSDIHDVKMDCIVTEEQTIFGEK